MSLTELDHRAVRRSFEAAASDYDANAVLQHEVESRLLDRLEFLRREPRIVLDAGCGTGIASAALAERYSRASVIGLDWSAAMLERARKRSGQPSLVCADMHDLPLAPRSVDLVFSNLAMQWSDRLQDLMTSVRRVLRPGGMLLFSTFGPDTLYELRQSWASVDSQTHVNRFPDMHNIGDLLVAAGLVDPVMDVDRITLEYRDVPTLMRELKAIGARNSAAGRRQGLTSPRALRGMLEAYEQFRRGGVYPATYEVIYGTAFGPAEGQPVRTGSGEEATFSVESLRTRRGEAK